MKEKEFREFYEKRRSTPEATKQAIQAVKKWEKQLNGEGKTIGAATIDDLKLYISKIVDTGESTEEKLLAIARYLHVIMRNDLYSYMATILGGRGVYNSISDRLADIAGEKKRKQVFHGFEQPPLGSEPEVYPSCTRELLERLNSTLPPEQVNLVLAGNHHRIPLEAFSEMKRRYEATATFSEFLDGEHKRLIGELEEAMRSGKLWYEQEITPDVVQLVKDDPRIQVGVLQGDVVIKTKIPYNPKMWLIEKDPKMRRYLACHCQLARTAILEGDTKALGGFCYCSAGYEKTPLEVVLEVPLEVEVIESVLKGDNVCKFSIKIPPDKLK